MLVTTTQLATTHPTAVPPNATVSSSSSSPLREGRDSVTLRCAADSNPPPTYIWVRGSDSGEVRATLDIPVSYINLRVTGGAGAHPDPEPRHPPGH